MNELQNMLLASLRDKVEASETGPMSAEDVQKLKDELAKCKEANKPV